MLEACEPSRKDGDTLENTICLSESTQIVHCGQNGNKGGCGGSPTEAQSEAKAPVRKLEGKLRLGKAMWLPTALLASRLADRVREQDNKLSKLGTLVGHFAKLGGPKLL